MSSIEQLQLLEGFVANNNLSVVVFSGVFDDTEDWTIQRIELHEGVTQEFRQSIESTTAISPNTVLRPYEAGYKPERHEMCWINLSEVPEIKELVDGLANVGDFEIFEAEDDVIRDLRFYSVVIQGKARSNAIFFRNYSQKKELTRGKGFALIMKRGSYDKVKSKVFLFDELIDFFAWNDVLYIKNVAQFQKIFLYYDALQEKAEKTIKEIAKRVPIDNESDFTNACKSNPTMLAKLASIANKPYLKDVSFKDIRKTIDEFELDIETNTKKGKERLVFDANPSKRWLILKLLDDDYLGSMMTNEKYEVNSKLRHT